MSIIGKPASQLKETPRNNDSKISTISLPYDPESITLIDDKGNKNSERQPLSIPHALKV